MLGSERRRRLELQFRQLQRQLGDAEWAFKTEVYKQACLRKEGLVKPIEKHVMDHLRKICPGLQVSSVSVNETTFELEKLDVTVGENLQHYTVGFATDGDLELYLGDSTDMSIRYFCGDNYDTFLVCKYPNDSSRFGCFLIRDCKQYEEVFKHWKVFKMYLCQKCPIVTLPDPNEDVCIMLGLLLGSPFNDHLSVFQKDLCRRLRHEGRLRSVTKRV